MTAQPEGAVRDELRIVEAQLVELRQTVAELRAEIGGRGDGTLEPEEIAATITSAEEQEALIGVLQQRRDRLAAQLGEA